MIFREGGKRQLMETIASLKATLARLQPAKLAGLGAAALAVLALIVWITLRPGEPMALLYSGLDPSEAGRIGQRLDELKIPFDAGSDGGTIMVPASQVARVRMELAASGLPHQTGAGYELLDSQSPMNMTSFMQRVQRLRALEGELSRTILTLDGVRSARVHIVMPERESFARDGAKPTASIAITMAGPMRITPRQAAAIRVLVAGAVPRLRQEDVSVVDPSGVVLAADDGDAMASSRLDELRTSREQALRRATLELLEPLIGRGKVRVAVSVDVDGTREVAREDKFDPLSQVERSKQTQLDQEKSDESKPSQAVSVGQNLPNQQPPTAAPGKTSSSSTHNNQTVNYELNSTHSERVREPGEIKHLAAAVVVDGTLNAKGEFQPRSKEELDRIAELVRSAVGYDAKRGDTVTVETMRFVAADNPAAETEAPAAPSVSNWQLLAAAATVIAIAAVAMLFLRKRRRAPAEPLMAPEPVPLAVTGPTEPLLLASEETSAQRQLIASLHHIVDTRPEEALAVIRTWIAESEAA